MKKIYTTLHHNFILFSKSPAAIVVNVLPLSLLLILGTIYPVVWILPQIITLSIIIICFTSVGIQYHEYRITKFKRYVNTTDISFPMILVGTFLVIFIISLFSSLTLIIMSWFFTRALPVLNETVDNIDFGIMGYDSISSYTMNLSFFSSFTLKNINWFMFCYSLILSLLLTSLMAVSFSYIFKSTNNYIIFSMIYILLFVVFGGVLIPIYIFENKEILNIFRNLIPNVHTSKMIDTAVNFSIQNEANKYINYCEELRIHIISYEELGYSSIKESLVSLRAEIQNNPDLYSDPLELSIVFTNWPYVSILLENIVAVMNSITSKNINPDLVTWVIIVNSILSLINPDKCDAFINGVSEGLLALNLSIDILVGDNYFLMNDLNGLIRNAIPYLYILILLGIFPIVKGE